MKYVNGYQPSRSQHLSIAKLVMEKYNIDGEVIIHYVLIDNPMRLYVQAEIHRKITANGVEYKDISFPRLDI
jgi:hypothetical protein